ncbi:hypothetical protein BpHYR1_021309, partial [Brachionus plicatilis]
GASSDDLSEYSELFEENGIINVLSIKDKNGRLSKICTETPAASIASQGFYRNYSAATTNTNDQILLKLNEIQNDFQNKHIDLVNKFDDVCKTNNELKHEIEKLNARVDDITKVVVDNNLKIVYFILDFFRYFTPASKPNSDAAQLINSIFKTHKLGTNLNVTELKNYIDKLWK